MAANCLPRITLWFDACLDRSVGGFGSLGGPTFGGDIFTAVAFLFGNGLSSGDRGRNPHVRSMKPPSPPPQWTLFIAHEIQSPLPPALAASSSSSRSIIIIAVQVMEEQREWRQSEFWISLRLSNRENRGPVGNMNMNPFFHGNRVMCWTKMGS